ncbi:hypothetical protein [Brevibacillus sp. SYSU BS000544]|uniref:hypothetical protein n=1 Tax=Brevibacillus sp. SYSU BS000544 TaxID=3416443 RepID=UPI003CE4A32D
MSSIQTLLQQFIERVNQKSFLRIVTRNWERRVGVVVKDRNQGFTLVISADRMEFRPWHDKADYDLLVRGDEQDIRMFFQGDELAYLHVKEKIETVGSIRDQLKLDSLIRLTAQQV